MTSKVQTAADYWTVHEKTWRRGCVIVGEQKNKELIFSFRSLKLFWINNKAIIEFGFRRIWRILQISIIANYYSFKIFPLLWLVKTNRMIHHNQLLLTKCGKNFVILNQWRQNDVKSVACCRLLKRWPRKPGDEVVLILVSRKTKSKMGNSIKNGEIFWMNNKETIELGFRRIKDYSMESSQEQFLFTSCAASKKRTGERSERVSFLMQCNEWIKIVQVLSMVWCFYFIHTKISSRLTHFKDCKPFKCNSKKHLQIHNLGRYSFSVHSYIFLPCYLFTH